MDNFIDIYILWGKKTGNMSESITPEQTQFIFKPIIAVTFKCGRQAAYHLVYRWTGDDLKLPQAAVAMIDQKKWYKQLD